MPRAPPSLEYLSVCVYLIFLFKLIYSFILNFTRINYFTKQWERNSSVSSLANTVAKWHTYRMHTSVSHTSLRPSQTYTVMQYTQHLHCHPMRFPHPFLFDGTVTNARKMAGNILSFEETIFMVQRRIHFKVETARAARRPPARVVVSHVCVCARACTCVAWVHGYVLLQPPSRWLIHHIRSLNGQHVIAAAEYSWSSLK